MQKLYFAYPGDLETPTGGYGYDRRIISGLSTAGWNVETLALGNGFPFPSAETLNNAQCLLEKIPDDSLVVVDGLAFGTLPEIAKKLAEKLHLIALVHHPLCQENGLRSDRSDILRKSENAALQHAQHVIVTSPATADQVVELFGIPKDQISTIVPGTDIPEPVVRSQSEWVNLLAVGTVVPRKGYDLLFEALSGIMDQNWRLNIVGGTGADLDCYNALLEMAEDLKLSDRIVFHGGVPKEALAGFYQSADVFVLASRYEGYGMAYTEALAHGLPVIGSGEGAVEETLANGAALYCGVENVEALRQALTQLISDPGKRCKLAKTAYEVAQNLPSWKGAVTKFEAVLSRFTT